MRGHGVSGPGGDPTLLTVLYDGLSEIKAAVTSLQASHNVQALEIERQLSEIRRRQVSRDDHEALVARLTKAEDELSTLKRMGWLLGIIGGMAVIVSTGVITDRISRALDAPRPPAAIAHPPTTTSQGP